MECKGNDGVVFVKSKRDKGLLLMEGYKYTFQRNNEHFKNLKKEINQLKKNKMSLH